MGLQLGMGSSSPVGVVSIGTSSMDSVLGREKKVAEEVVNEGRFLPRFDRAISLMKMVTVLLSEFLIKA